MAIVYLLDQMLARLTTPPPLPAPPAGAPPVTDIVWNPQGTDSGIRTGRGRPCLVLGCHRFRIEVVWTGGKLSWPCLRGLQPRADGSSQIVRAHTELRALRRGAGGPFGAEHPLPATDQPLASFPLGAKGAPNGAQVFVGAYTATVAVEAGASPDRFGVTVMVTRTVDEAVIGGVQFLIDTPEVAAQVAGLSFPTLVDHVLDQFRRDNWLTRLLLHGDPSYLHHESLQRLLPIPESAP